MMKRGVCIMSALLLALQRLISHPLRRNSKGLIHEPGFTGNAPGAPSRWSTERSTQWKPLAPKLVVEVSFDHVTDDRFRHGTKVSKISA